MSRGGVDGGRYDRRRGPDQQGGTYGRGGDESAAPGDYRVRLEEGDGARSWLEEHASTRSAPVTWTADGPLQPEVRL